MLRIHARVLLALLALVFVTGATTTGLVIGLAIEEFWFLAGAAAVGFPVLVVWGLDGYLAERNKQAADEQCP